MNAPPYVSNPLEDRLTKAGIDVHDNDLVEAGVRAQLRLAGCDPTEQGLTKTPQRVRQAWAEMTTPGADPLELFHTLFDVAADEMVVVGPVTFTSLCEHHLMPFTGDAWVGYLPQGGRVAGLSKLPRLVDWAAKRPQVQERLTRMVTDELDHYVTDMGSACVTRALHACAQHRGVKATAPLTCSSLTRNFRTPEVRSEFFTLAGING